MTGARLPEVLLPDGAPPGARRRARRAGLPRTAATVALVSWLLAGAAAVLHVASGADLTADDVLFVVVDLTVAAVYGTVGAVILSRRRHPVGWIVSFTGVAGGISAVGGAWASLSAARPGLPELDPLVRAYGWIWVPGTVALFTVVPWLTRDRSLGPAAWAGVTLGVGAAALLTATRLLTPMSDARWALAVVVVSGLVTAAATWWRHRHGPPEERRGLGLLAVGTGVMALSFVPLLLVDPGRGLFLAVPISHLACQALFPAALLVTVLRNRLWGLDLAVSRATVAALLTLGLVAVYAAVAVAVTALVGSEPTAQVVAAVGVVLAVQPGRNWLQARVTRLVYGDGDDPGGAALLVGRRLADARGSQGLLDGLVSGVGTSLRLECVVLRSVALLPTTLPTAMPGLGDVLEPMVATWGRATSPPTSCDLVHGGRVIGTLSATAPPGERLDPRTRTTLEQVAPVVAAGLALALGARDLEQAREATTRARLQERRVIRRELHDGLGPWLGGLRLGLQGVLNRMDTDPAVARDVLIALQAETARRVDDVRDLARSLLPPVLDELGLTAALAELADRHARDGFTMTVTGDPIAELDPAVAAAAYGILREASLNARRHSGADGCRVTVRRLDGELVLTCDDDGRGPAGDAGVGSRTMRERAEELGGGVAVIGLMPGTRVQAVLPVPGWGRSGGDGGGGGRATGADRRVGAVET